ncbi:MAG: PD-(D/E)XK nuclease family protein [Bacteroidetes bacterium]|nr:PD-(D/E)XK nuclease family protein [Bacteroidota bacterium]
MSLIKNISGLLLQHAPHELKDIMVVFPNRRAGLFLRRELSQALKQPAWLPEILSLEEALSRWSGFAPADNLSMIVELIRFQLAEGGQTGHEAAAFVGYARQMVADFDEIDHSLAPPEAVFSALSEAKAAEVWHPDGSPLSHYEQAYLRFFNSLIHYYRHLYNRLSANGLLWSGAMARQLAVLSTEEWERLLPDTTIWFAGFNALTPAEEKIITTLHGMGKAKLFWDLDEYYLQAGPQGQQLAGTFMRRFMKKYPGLVTDWIGNTLATKPMNITVIATSGAVAQAKALGTMLRNQAFESNTTEQAIVLADEKLLEPVIQSLPEETGAFNITMGYPLSHTPLFQLADNLARLAVQPNSGQQQALPLLLLLDVLTSPAISRSLTGATRNDLLTLVRRMASDGSNLVYIHRLEQHLADLSEETSRLLHKLLEIRSSTASALPGAIGDWLREAGLPDTGDDLAANQYYELMRLLNHLALALQSAGLEAREAVPVLLRQLGQQARIKLSGEPLSGLQVMGVLETRNLAFRRVHLLSANEGSLPPASSHGSLIPADIRRAFGLPMRSDKDAIAAFHFYQLLQHADELVFYYSTEPDALGGGEMSRFLLQIRHELMKINPNISWHEIAFQPPLPSGAAGITIEIPKNEAVLQAIAQKAEAGISPSALSRWFNCSLQFYLADILNIREKTRPGEPPGHNVTGTIIHRAIELIYTPFMNSSLNAKALSELKHSIDRAVDEAFAEVLPGVSTGFGRNALTYAIVKTMVRRAIEADEATIANCKEIKLLQQENQLEATIDGPAGTIKIKGYPDRIDKTGSIVRVIDYKTGSVKEDKLKLKEREDLKQPERKYALQLACYMLMTRKSLAFNYENTSVEGYILPLKLSKPQVVQAQLPFDPDPEMAEFEEFLSETLSEMLNPDVPIAQTMDEKRCKNCTFVRLCNREAMV